MNTETVRHNEVASSPTNGVSLPRRSLIPEGSYAPLFIHSSDQSLKPSTPPSIFAHLNEGDRIWRLTHTPLANKDPIIDRQRIIQGFAKLQSEAGGSSLPELIFQKASAYQLRDNLSRLGKEYELDSFSSLTREQVTLISRYSGTACRKISLLSLVKTISQGECAGHIGNLYQNVLDQINKAKAATQRIVTLLANHSAHQSALAPFSRELSSYTTFLDQLNDAFFRSDRCDLSTLEADAIHLDEILREVGLFAELGNLVHRGDLCLVTFNNDQPEVYSGGYSVLCPDSKRSPNHSPDSQHTVVAYVGVHQSGKSESGLKMNLSMQMLAQAWGVTSAQSANMRCYGRILYLDRVGSQQTANLSAFASELDNHAKAYAQSGNPTLAFLDEWYSSTTPHVQHRFVIAGINSLMRDGGRVFISLHNEETIRAALGKPRWGVYHFPVNLSEPHRPVYSRKLTMGAQDAGSLHVARVLGAPEHILQQANELKRGAALQVEAPPQPSWSAIEPYSEEQRATMRTIPRRLAELFPSATSGDQGLVVTKSPASKLCQIPLSSQWIKEFEISHGNWRFRPGPDENYLREIVFNAPHTLAVSDVLLRREFLEAIALPQPRKAIMKLRQWLEYVKRGVNSWQQVAKSLEDINEAFNPVHSKHTSYDHFLIASSEPLELTWHLLKLNQSALKESFLYNDLEHLVSRVLTVARRCEDELLNLPVRKLVESLRNQAIAKLSQEELAVYTSIRDIAGSACADSMHSPSRNTVAEAVLPLSYSPESYSTAPLAQKLLHINCRPLWHDFEDLNNLEQSWANMNLRELCAAKGESNSLDGVSSDDLLRCITVLRDALPVIPITSEDILQEIRSLAPHIAGASPMTNSIYTLAAIRELGQVLFERARSILHADIPPAPAYNCSVEELREHLVPLLIHRIGSPSGDPENADVAALLIAALAERDPIMDLVNALQSTDSVFAHQFALHLEMTSTSQGEPSGPGSLQELVPRLSDAYRVRPRPSAIGAPKLADPELLREVTESANNLVSLLALSDATDPHGGTKGFCNVSFTCTGIVELHSVKNFSQSVGADPQNVVFEIGRRRIAVVQSPHTSGKTWLLTTVLINAAMARSIGRACAERVSIPPLSGVVFLDRVRSKEEESESAGSTDIKKWIEILNILQSRSDSPLLFLFDEPLTTLPESYRVPLLKALVAEAYKLGHLGMVATHDHGAAEALAQACPNIFQIHLAYDVTSDGVKFTRVVRDGPAPSMALQVAEERLPPDLMDFIKQEFEDDASA
jgi:hypothetical protein